MFVCISNASERNPENYDKLIQLESIEESISLSRDWIVSKKGVCHPKKCMYNPGTKEYLQECYLKGVNQIVSNDSKTNFTYETPTGEIIEFVGINNHLEKEINDEL